MQAEVRIFFLCIFHIFDVVCIEMGIYAKHARNLVDFCCCMLTSLVECEIYLKSIWFSFAVSRRASFHRRRRCPLSTYKHCTKQSRTRLRYVMSEFECINWTRRDTIDFDISSARFVCDDKVLICPVLVYTYMRR